MQPEVEAVVVTLEELWAKIKQIVQEVGPDGLRYDPGEGFNSISVIVTHVAGSQKWWIGEVLGGREVHRNRDAEFRSPPVDASRLVQRLDDSAELVRDILTTLTADMLHEIRLYKGQALPTSGGQAVTVPWILARVLSHTALHLGHIQITRKWWKLLQEGESGSIT